MNTHEDMDASHRHKVERKKPGTEVHIWYDFILMEIEVRIMANL